MVLTLALSLAACGGEDSSEAPAQSSSAAAAAAPEVARPSAGGLTWEAPAPLERRPPANPMRMADYGVQGHEDATLAVFFFDATQGGGGSVQSNIDRWLGQFQQPDGKPTREVAETREREVNGMKVTTVDARGTFVGQIGMAAGEARPEHRVLGAIVEGPEGPVFFKLTGPEAAVTAAEGAFAHLVESVQLL